ncbi:GNAT family N-acetyltransferase [Cribrihabitans neustonicus]|uniref:GNAT family N-acetyltransferase n=1 Tax=Cribrihabitans neustonicus TaxID=1429085 RepID=UPI003B597E5E
MSLLDLQTPRLRAGRWQDLAEGDLATLFADPVVRWLPPGFQGLSQAAAQRGFLGGLAEQAEVAALFDEAGRGAGLVILSLPEPGSRIRSLGYLLAEDVWGRGLAGELLAALQAHFHGSGVTLRGGVMQANAASARVLARAGFSAEAQAGETVYSWTAEAPGH